MPQAFKDVLINGQQYRIGLLKAADGSWIKMVFTRRYREYMETQEPQPAPDPSAPPAPQVDPELGFAMTAGFIIEHLSRAEMAEVQALCLSVCGRYDSRLGSPIAKPILFPDGRWAIPELEYDAPTVLELTQNCIAFNIAPFFPAASSSSAQTPAADSSQPNTQT
jgi:hypothetical protein